MALLFCFHPHKLKAAEPEPIPYEQTAIYKPTIEQETEALSHYLTEKATKLIGKKGGQCVVFVRTFAGVGRDKVQGLAKNNKINSTVPTIGAVIKTKESWYGHVAVVIAIKEDQIQIVESNYHWNQRVSIRWIKITNPKIAGYII